MTTTPAGNTPVHHETICDTERARELLEKIGLFGTPPTGMPRQYVRDIFCNVVPCICKHDTTAWPGTYNQNSSLHGHSDVITLLAQEIFGGDIRRRSVTSRGFRYENILPSGEVIDFLTDADHGLERDKPHERCDRDAVLRDFNIATRYTILRRRFYEKLAEPLKALVEAYAQLHAYHQAGLLNSPKNLLQAAYPTARQSDA